MLRYWNQPGSNLETSEMDHDFIPTMFVAQISDGVEELLIVDIHEFDEILDLTADAFSFYQL